MIRKKLKEWFKRYAFAELVGVVFALVFSNVSMLFFGNEIVSGFIGTWSNNLGFYGIIISKDIKERRKRNKILGMKDYLAQLRNVIVEFGPAEYLDTFLIRPFYLIFLPYVMPNYSLAILAGTILADITYFIPTIISYEFRKKAFRN